MVLSLTLPSPLALASLSVLLLVAGLFAPLSCASHTSFSANGFSLTWTTNATEITFTMSAPVSGWLGFGLTRSNANPPHLNADAYVGWVSDNKVTLLDTYFNTNGAKAPALDTAIGGVNSLQVISGSLVR